MAHQKYIVHSDTSKMKKIENLTVRRAEESDELEKKVNMANAVINNIKAMIGFKNDILTLVENAPREASFEFHRTGKKPEESHAQFLTKTQGGEIPQAEKDSRWTSRKDDQGWKLNASFPIFHSVFSGKMGVPLILVAL
ncbi:hypothetical protein CRE_09895 [Caenorhabditis remanei]|uniref:Uncharacterized protein n=1 Tax=Caenorhabditis remanei TaxID=31234 RepID=E3NMQ2_CAERE|nr:hypothetical protein CRE_09895 [Caenorhabditis remanei]